jgi:acetolactate synthase-1/2/3 large subunit
VNISGAELIIDLLEQRGVDIVAGMPGGALLPLYEALGGSKQIRHVLARHEQAAGFIAQGMARLSGRAGVCFVTSGPGVTNVVTALADAKLDSVPLVCIAGQVPTHLIGTDAFQEVHTLDIVRRVTKGCYFVKSATDIIDIFDEAFHVAERGRPGPVLIDLPKDIQTERILMEEVRCRRQTVLPSLPRSADQSPVYDRAAALIAVAERPVFYIGGGVIGARAHALVRELAELTDIPVTTTLMALGLLPHDHALNLGMLGMHGARYTNHVIDAADLLIAIGARFDDRATGSPETFAPQANIIHIDIDPRELGKIKPPTLAIEDDAARATHELLKRMQVLTSRHLRRGAWHSHIQRLRESHPLRMPRCEQICSPYGIMRALGKVLSEDTVVTTDVGQHQMWAAQALPLRCAGRWLTSGGLGTMGFGLPAAIGAALVNPGAPVVCLTGDGSLLVNLQELATLAELDLDVKVILLDNAALGLVRQQQELFYRKRFVGSRFPRRTDFVSIASAFQIRARDLGRESDPCEVLELAMNTRGPWLIRVPIEESEHVFPFVAPGGANTQSLDYS